jgi:carbonic anhydrase/acetyltransferase-like protein (isoleucine patch superfamily)
MPSNIHSTAWIAPTATVIGNATIEAEASVWFGAVIRADTADIFVGKRSNIQDGCILHADPGFPCRIGSQVTLGHGAIVHGATVEEDVLIGMRAVVMNGAVIGRGSIVGVGAVVPEGRQIPPGSVWVGTPARKVRDVSEKDSEAIEHAWTHYVELQKAYAMGKMASL